MVRQRDIVEREQLVVLRQRLHREHIDRRAHDPVLLQRGIQRLHIDQHGARRIDEHGGGLHRTQLLLADDRRVARADAPVQGDEITAAQQLFLADRLAACGCDGLCRDERVADQNFRAEDLQPLGDQTADGAEADNADVRAAQLRNSCGIRIFFDPCAAAQTTVGACDISRFRDHQADCVFRDGDGVVRRAVDYADAVLMCGLQVDVFHAAACREDVAELRRGLKHLARDGEQMAENDLCVLQPLQLLLRGQERTGTARFHSTHDIAELVALFCHVPVKRIIRRDPRCRPDRLIEDRGREKKISNCNCFHTCLSPFLFSRSKDRR